MTREFRLWQRKWRRSKRSFYRKVMKLERGGFERLKRDGPYYLTVDGYVS
jgi:hypothetical protein